MNKSIGLRSIHWLVLLTLLLSGCASAAQTITDIPAAFPAPQSTPISPTNTAPPLPTYTAVPILQPENTATLPEPAPTESSPQPSDNSAPPAAEPQPTQAEGSIPNTGSGPAVQQAVTLPLSPDQWQQWPVQPVRVSEQLREIYRQGIAQGNDPHAYSILGDCQSQPDVFMGIYDSTPSFVQTLSPALQETVAQFSGSFNRYSPTIKDGTTEGALLWAQWNDNPEGNCQPNESPIDCELRVHRPSIVFVHIGTHWEARNYHYLTILIDKILASKAVPVLVTKADNRELDSRVNHNLAILAAEYDLPLWNFWASVQHLPENGMEPGSTMYLSQDGLVVHRQGALDVLDLVWRSVR